MHYFKSNSSFRYNKRNEMEERERKLEKQFVRKETMESGRRGREREDNMSTAT